MTEKTKLTINVPKAKKEKLQEIAERKGITMTSMIVLAMNKIIKNDYKNRKGDVKSVC